MIRQELAKLLMVNGYETYVVTCFDDIISELKTIKTDLVLLDVNLPGENGYALCKRIRKEKNVPIIFVTCRDSDEDELLSIKSGGIDYITKPYNKLILLEKIKRALALYENKNLKEIRRKEYILDLHLSRLKYRDKEIELTRNEFKLLYYFFMQDERIITKDELIEYLWNDKCYVDESILVVNINRLRKKAKEIGIEHMLETIWKKGYRL